jgi:hypothetical protein
MQDKPKLKIDWASHEAAKYACENWHYSQCTPKGKQVWIGVWENEKFIGVVAFGRSTTPYLGTAYGLETDQCAELTRVALKTHKTPVSKIISIGKRFIKKQSPNLRLLVSLADGTQGHHGGIYQATNWIYVGRSAAVTQFYFRGKWRNDSNLGRFLKENPKAKNLMVSRKVEGKHKYLMPLDDEMRAKITPLAKPYPKRVKKQDSEHPSELGGAVPTDTLHSSIEA